MSEDKQKLFNEAKERFDRAMTWESFARKNWIEDYKFGMGDSENLYQWPKRVLEQREGEPCLTINKVDQHCLHIINNSKQNQSTVTIRPVGNGATVKSADVWTSIIKHIMYISNAESAFNKATEGQVYGGIGYWRIITDYAEGQTFNQEIYIKPINNPLNVLIDPDSKEADKTDARYAFLFEDMSYDEAKKAYPKYKNKFASPALGNTEGWADKNTIRIAEYYRQYDKTERIYEVGNTIISEEMLDAGMRAQAKENKYRSREVVTKAIKWHLIIGNEIVETKDWVGKYIPIIPLVGREFIIESKLDRKGHVRNMRDAQRMYNYWSSTAVKYGALQTKTPWMGPAAAFESYDEIWKNANIENKPYLPYNHLDDAGQPIPPPQRIEPPVAAPVALSGMQIAQQEMAMASGQYDAQMGMPGNERSGDALELRQRASANSTYHFDDQQSVSMRNTGKQLLDLVPKIYDTQRVLQLVAEDQTDYEIQVDPTAQAAYKEENINNQEAVKRIFNPNIGKYEVQADVGPNFASKRDQSLKAISLILTQAPNLTPLIGDLLMRSADFPLAMEAAARLRRMVPPVALGIGPSETEGMLQQQVQKLQGILQDTMKELTIAQIKAKGKDQLRDIDAYKALTERLNVLKDVPGSEDEMQAALAQVVDQLVTATLDRALAAGAPTLAKAAEEGKMALPHFPLPRGAVESANGLLYRADPAGSARFKPIR